MCLADFASSYVSKKVDDLSIESDEIKSYIVPVSKINDVMKIDTRRLKVTYCII